MARRISFNAFGVKLLQKRLTTLNTVKKLMKMVRRWIPWLTAAIVVVVVTVVAGTWDQGHSMALDTFYGKIDIDDPIIYDLVKSKAMQRLKQVHQYGVDRYANPTEAYSRYDHSVGVYVLLRRYHASLAEQIAGLLHDASHTAFSHVGDVVFDHHSPTSSYADDIHDWYLRHSGIADVLERHGYTVESIHHKVGNFKALEQDLPTLCADRIDYNLQGGVRRGLLHRRDVEDILTHLKFEYPHWYFTDAARAKKLGRVSLNMTENVWGSPWGQLVYLWAADAIRHAMKIGLISLDDLHFSTDDILWHRLVASKDPVIVGNLNKLRNFERQFVLCEPVERDLLLKAKFRGIDPFVQTERGLKRLTEVDPEYAEEYNAVKQKMIRGWSIKLTNKDNDAGTSAECFSYSTGRTNMPPKAA